MTRPDPPRRLRRLGDVPAGPDGVLAGLRATAARLRRVDAALRECLDPTIAAHLRTASIDRHRLLLHADSPAFAARARYMAPAIAEALRERLGDVIPHRVDVATRPITGSSVTERSRAPAPLSTRTRALLLAVAETTGEERLRRILRRLAGRGR